MHGVVNGGRVAVEQRLQVVEYRQAPCQQRAAPLQGVDELEAEPLFHRRRDYQVGGRKQVIEAQPVRVEPLTDAAQAGDRGVGKQPLDRLPIRGLGRGGGGQGHDQVGSGEPRQQASLQHVLAPPHAHRIEPQGTFGVEAAGPDRRPFRSRFGQPDARCMRRCRIDRRNQGCRPHRVAEQDDTFGGTAGNHQGVVIAPVQHGVADVASRGIGIGGHLALQAFEVRRPRVLREVVNLQNHRLSGGGSQQDRSREAGVLGQVMVVDPPHPVPETAQQQVGEPALPGGGGGRVVVPHRIEAAAFDRRAEPPAVLSTGHHDQPVQAGKQAAVGEQGAGAVADYRGDPAGQQVVVEDVQMQTGRPRSDGTSLRPARQAGARCEESTPSRANRVRTPAVFRPLS